MCKTIARRHARAALLALFGAVVLGSVAAGTGTATPVPAGTERVALSSSGTQPDADINQAASLTPDARYVVFASDSPNLAPGATGGTGPFVYVRDRGAETTQLVSRGVGGAAPNGGSVTGLGAPVISADGRYVAFASLASNLVTGDDNGAADVFVFDRSSGTTARISVTSGGVQANASSSNPSISADGHVVVFQSQAANLVDGDANGQPDVFWHNNLSGATVRVSAGTGVDANGASTATSGAVSGDGTFVAFTSSAANLVAADANGPTSDVFVRDVPGATTEVASK